MIRRRNLLGQGVVVTSWDVSNAVYENKYKSLGGQDSAPANIFFTSDGKKMYMIGYAQDTVYQYELSTAWDVSTASYSNKSFSVTTQEAYPWGVFFSTDGLKMYAVGIGSDTVYQYALSTAWDVSTASYNNIHFSVNSQDSNPQSVFFSTDGLKMYILGNTGNKVYQYTLSTAWDVSTASYANISFSIAFEETDPRGMFISTDGLKMYVVGIAGGKILQYELLTAWDISTASYYNISFGITSQDTSPSGLFFKSDGTKMYMTGTANDKVHQYGL